MVAKGPEYEAARLYMEHKGYPDIEPVEVDPLEDQPCWYFIYELTEGTLELEVFWNGQEWETTVTSFTIHQDQGEK